MNDIRLETPRLVLRELTERDRTDVHAYASDPDVTRFLPWGPNTQQDTDAFLREVVGWSTEVPRLQFILGIEVRGERRVAGSCRLQVTELEHRGAAIGYALGRRDWGKGYASETVEALLGFGFEQLGLHRIWAVCDPANSASARVLEKAGLRREGEMLEHRWEKGRWCDELLYAILEREWGPRRRP
jgi:RimJ/RimL family protein N-acetyltransferase